MTNFPFDIVGFDLDGTLLDTSEDLAAATNHALALAGRPLLELPAVKTMIGRGAKAMLEMSLEASGGFDKELMDRVYPELLTYYEANVSRGSKPFPGMLDALDRLDALGVKAAIVTNKFERFAVKLIGELGLAHRFAALIGGDTMGRGNAKPSALPIHEMIARCQALGGGGRAAFVGDSIYDTLAAKNAGIPSIAVSFGFLMQPVEELHADAVIDSYDELIPALERLGAA
ncbi:HAD hydrolase-like protein [Sphingomonas sp. G-3-2-10]|uniref:HAD hydrolase-like protein n=1 Tax=Sphingomonas sp. G-3-2-10 TaxID=2728838 RepID=UPI00146AA32C|nr:HAD hydrolase-like protein [Sphingomonas sp. G-3-2-10]NML06294.1 HAD hydrolase-like protein [Sphingomonas sp. G-3-2-10]